MRLLTCLVMLNVCLALVRVQVAAAQTSAQTTPSKIVVIQDEAAIKVGGQTVSEAYPGYIFYRGKTSGGWIWIESEKGWISKASVIPFEEALEHFNAAIEKDPTNAELYYARSRVFGGAHSPEFSGLWNTAQAIADLTTAIRLRPGAADYHNWRAVNYRLSDDIDDAIRDYTEAIHLAPRWAVLYGNRANCWGYKGEYSKAVADCIKGLELDPTWPWLWGESGYAREMLGQYETAISHYKESIRLQPSEAFSMRRLAWIYATCNDSALRNGSSAIDLGKQACELTKWKDAWYLDSLAAAYAETRDFDQAIEWQEKAVKIDPTIGVFKERLSLYKSGTPYHEAPLNGRPPSIEGPQKWIGELVMPKMGARLMLDEKEVPWKFVGLAHAVKQEKGDRLWLGRGWIEKDQAVPLEDAVAYYTLYLERNPKDSLAYVRRGLAKVENHHGGPQALQDRLADFNQALQLAPENPWTRYGLGVHWGESSFLEETAKHPFDHYSKAIKLDPQFALAYVGLGDSWRELRDDNTKAAAEYAQALTIDPKNVKALISRVYNHRQLGNDEKALADCSEAIKIDPQQGYFLSLRASLHVALGEYQKALDDHDSYIRLSPDAAAAYSKKAWILATCPDAQFRDEKEAVMLATKACEMHRTIAYQPMQIMAAAYAETGDFDSAVEWQEKSIKIQTSENKSLQEERLKLYQAGKPHRDTENKGPP